MRTKQVIVIRYKYPDGKGGTMGMRTGKLIAQACHASMSFMTRRLQEMIIPVWTEAELNWIEGSFAKVCCRVDSEEELLEIYEKAKAAGLEAHLITDNGMTEFKEPTRTCIAIGPDLAEKIDEITGCLKLL
jgi:PTH2 family peptidyl-tRNA hydrolase